MITVNGREADWRQGMTVSDLLQEHGYTAPRIIVKVNGKLVRQQVWETFTLGDGDDVRAIHMVAGG